MCFRFIVNLIAGLFYKSREEQGQTFDGDYKTILSNNVYQSVKDVKLQHVKKKKNCFVHTAEFNSCFSEIKIMSLTHLAILKRAFVL